MDNIEITVFDEIKDYKEKIYFFNFRQWVFAILIVICVVPTYLLLKDKIGEDITSYIVIAIAGVLGFIGFIKIHELPAEKVIPFWIRHYLLFAKPLHYITDADYEMQHSKNKKKVKSESAKNSKKEIKENRKKIKEKKMLEKARKKYGTKLENKKDRKNNLKNEQQNDELSKKLSKLTKEQQEALLKLLER